MSDLKVYEDMVNAKAEEKSTEILPNAGEFHAAIVMSKMFEKTQKSVNMVVGSFDGRVSGQDRYMNQLKSCVEKNIPINVLFLQKPNEVSKAFLYLKEMKAKNHPITFKTAGEEERKNFIKNKHEVHYSVFDDDKYRYEKDTNKFLAWFCFNDSNTAKTLNNIFFKAFETSTELPN